MTFHLNEIQWGQNFPNISQPKIMGYFSVDGDKQLSFDSSQLQYYHSPTGKRIHFDLNDGINSVRRKPDSPDNEKLYHLLQWIIQQMPPPPDNKKWLPTDFVCLRGLITKIVKTPYDKRDGWIICAAKWRGTIYLCGFDTDADKYEKNNRTKKDLAFMSWGFKFEQYILSDAPGKQPDTTKPVNEAAEFCCIFVTRFVNNRILYGAEMDGIECKEILSDPLPIEKLKFIELKTNRNVETPQQFANLKKFKFLKWWCQSFLVGIENVICGLRDDKGIVRKIQNYRVSDLARMSKKFWSAADAMNFCDIFLQHVSKTVINNCDETIYKFERIPFGDIITTEVSPSSEYCFLPQWYMQRKNKNI